MASDDLPLLRFRCSECGYGASSRRKPARCPMCGALSWLDDRRGSFSDITLDLAAAARRAGMIAGGDADAPLLREAAEVSIFPGVPLS